MLLSLFMLSTFGSQITHKHKLLFMCHSICNWCAVPVLAPLMAPGLDVGVDFMLRDRNVISIKILLHLCYSIFKA